jgi:hypothetical protein
LRERPVDRELATPEVAVDTKRILRQLEQFDDGYFEAFAIMAQDEDGEWGFVSAAGDKEDLDDEYCRRMDNGGGAKIVKVAIIEVE